MSDDYELPDDDDDGAGWWQMVTQDQLDAMADAIARDDFADAIAPALAKTGGGYVPQQLDDGEHLDHGGPRAPRPDQSQGQSYPLGGGSPADDLRRALADGLGRPI